MELDTLIKQKLFKKYNKKKGPEKNKCFYRELISLYKKYPRTIIKILVNVDKWGYHKDIINILSLSTNYNLNKKIYMFICNKLKDDYQKLKLKGNVSSLAKWLPREKAKLNKDIGFIDNLTQFLYPDIEDYRSRCAKYRRLVTTLTREFGSIATLFCEKKYDKIDPNLMTVVSIRHHKTSIMKNPSLRQRTVDYLTGIYDDIPLYGFVKWVLNSKITELEKDALKNHWDKTNEIYFNKISKSLGISFNNLDIIIDLRTMKNYNNFCMFVGLATLICKNTDNNVIMNNTSPLLFKTNDGILDTIAQISWNKTDLKTFDIEACLKLTKKNRILVISSLSCPANIQDNTQEKKITYWHLNSNEQKESIKLQNIKLITGNIVKHRKTKYDQSKKVIEDILSNSEEIKKKNIIFKQIQLQRLRYKQFKKIMRLICIFLLLMCIYTFYFI